MAESITYLGEVQYANWPLYDISWRQSGRMDLLIDSHAIRGSSLAGPLALVPSRALGGLGIEIYEDSLEDDEGGKSSKILMYTSSGNKLSEVTLDEGTVLAGVGWNDREQLVTVDEFGSSRIYNIWGELISEFQMGSVEAHVPLLECHFWGDGVVGMGADMNLYVAENYAVRSQTLPPSTNGSPPLSDVNTYIMATNIHPEQGYASMTIAPPSLSRSALLEVIIGTNDKTILIVDESKVEDQVLEGEIPAPVTKMSLDPSGRYLACYRSDGMLTVVLSTFTAKVLDFDTKSVRKPLDMQWCGDDAVLLVWRNMGVVMVGPDGDWHNFQYDGSVHLVPEPDCCRIITPTGCDMLQRVPLSTVMIRKVGSTEPAALIKDAMEAFENGDPESDVNIRSIADTNQLGEAISTCVESASTEFDIGRQRELLKAASYGKAFCSDLDPQEFVDAARKLRVLNDVRKKDIGMPLTSAQFDLLTPEALIGRLTLRKQHFLALRICSLLQLRNESVLLHWAVEKIKKLASMQPSMEDEKIAAIIRDKLLAHNNDLSFLEVAAAAYRMGRRKLATMILNFEAHTADQVPLLLSMGEEELALHKAVYSEDTDLVYLVLIHLEHSIKTESDKEAFHKLVHKYPEAVNLLKVYYRSKITSGDKTLLHDFMMFNRHLLEAGKCAVMQSQLQSSGSSRINLLREASGLFGQGRDLGLLKSITDEHVELLELQSDYEKRAPGVDFTGLSVNETLAKLTELAVEFPQDTSLWHREANKIVKKFKVSERALWHIKIATYGRMSAWAHLSRLANERKSPVGYAPFARVSIKYNQSSSDIERYIDKIGSLEEKFDLFVDMKDWRKAADSARTLRDGERLTAIYNQCRDPTLQRQVKDLLTKL